MLNLTREKILAILVIAPTIFVLGLAAFTLGEIQSKPFDSTTVPQEVKDGAAEPNQTVVFRPL
ncbi:MAG TPA: hypothetical protein VEL70_00755, partial [Candidatus Acidoferrum sp.]|nr:hypothetical protein [Candidatus Acidoferrum sp.]